jgi:MFS family permease
MNPSTPHQALALRSLVVLPGSLVEGALAVVLPWLVAQASLGTTWLGLLSALLVAAALVGTLSAPLATKHWGSRRVVLAGALVSAAGLGVAAALWFLGVVAPAFGVALLAIAADCMADVAFSARTPVMARLEKAPLMQFTSANWLWSVCGVALGSGLAGITMGDGTLKSPSIAWLAAGMAALSLLVAMALAVLMPRDARISHGMRGVPVTHSRRVLWNQRTVLLLVLIAGMSFLYGPLDNLLAPAHLASNDREASTFGAIMAAGAVGLAAGLFLTQTVRADRYGMVLLSVGFAGIVAQLALLWWLPSDLALVVVSFVTAAAVAPLLPLLETSALKAVASTHRTMLLAAAATAASLADLAGTAVFGALAGAAGTSSALGVAAVLAGLGFPVALLMAKRVILPRTHPNSTI